jgi:methionine-rich copper-binding protein CopC
VAYDGPSQTATLTPTAALAASITYTAIVKGGAGGVTDLAGNALAADKVWSFTTAPAVDTTPPTVTSTTPADGTTIVSSGTTVTAQFSEAMDGATINGTTFELHDGDATGPLVAATVTYDGPSQTATLTPTAALVAGPYTAIVKGGAGGVTDVAGIALAADKIWSFAVDTTPPTVTSTTPADGTTSVSSGTTVTAQFSEAMDGATINGTTFELRDQANGLVAGSISYDAATRTATLTPDAALAAGAAYTATIIGGALGVTDLAGNPLATDFTWSFTTVTAQPVQLTLISIASEDGWVRESSENSNVGGSIAAGGGGSAGLRVGDATQDRQYKTIVSFDTSAIPVGATIQSAKLRLRRGTVNGTNPFGSYGGLCLVDVADLGGFGGNTALAAGDFQAVAAVVAAAELTDAPSNGSWSEGDLNADGLAAIDTAGTTQLRVYFEVDDNDDGGNDYIGYYAANNGTAANRPQLVIDYLPPPET